MFKKSKDYEKVTKNILDIIVIHGYKRSYLIKNDLSYLRK